MPASRRSVARAAAVVTVCLALGGGVAGLGAAGGERVGGVPLLALCAGLAMLIQWLAWIPAALRRDESFFDLTGSLTYLTVTGFALAMAGPPSPRQWLVAALVWIWAARLGSFLLRRVRQDGGDGRFDEIKVDPARFLSVWTIQGLWVFFTAAAALIVLTRAEAGAPWSPWDALGGAMWSAGFAVEVIADRQKRAFKARPESAGRWIDEGLWSWSQHPNYFGEILLWSGVAVIGAGVFEGGQWVGLLSPLFVALLLTRVSGIPLLDARAEARWGDDPEFRAYRERTSVLLPRPPRRG